MGGPRLLVFIVAYFAESTIENVLRRIPSSLANEYDVEVLIIDDGSSDATFARAFGVQNQDAFPFKLTVLHNPVNQGYGGNQKIGFHYAIENGYDYVALLHGDGQYAPEMLPDLLEPLRKDQADVVFGSRMIGSWSALKGGMPLYKFIGNKILSRIQNWLLNTKLTEFHSGYRVYSVASLKKIPFERNANVFHFDTEIIIQLIFSHQRIKEVAIPTYYGSEICYVNGLKYAKDVLKASLQAKLQEESLFYDRRFDCSSALDVAYPSKLDFDSSHSRVLQLIPSGSRVLDLGAGSGAVGAALKEKGCYVVGCDVEPGPLADKFDRFTRANLNDGLPQLENEVFDYVIALDVIEHLRSPEDFLDTLRATTAKWPQVTVILTTANIGFILMRLSLLCGRFEYGKRGILDLTHTRLFTMATFRRLLTAAGFEVFGEEGIVVPAPFVFGSSLLSRWIMAVNSALVKLRPELFGFQLLVRAKVRPTLATLLEHAEVAADKKRSDLETEARAA